MITERFIRVIHRFKGGPRMANTPPRDLLLKVVVALERGDPVLNARGWECEFAMRWARHYRVPFVLGWSAQLEMFVFRTATEKQVDDLAGIP